MEVRIVRIFNTYGPRMALDDGRVVSNFVAQVGVCLCGQRVLWVGPFFFIPLRPPAWLPEQHEGGCACAATDCTGWD